MQIKKPVGIGYGFKLHNFPINERFSKFQGCCQYIRQNHKLIFPPFGNDFVPSSKNIILKGHSIQSDICDYNHRCLMWSGSIFDYIIMNIFRNKALELHGEVVDSDFTKNDKPNLYVQRVTSIFLLEERHSWNSWYFMYTFQCWNNKNETIFVQCIKCDTQSDDTKKK